MKNKKPLFIILVIVVILALAGGAYYYYYLLQNKRELMSLGEGDDKIEYLELKPTDLSAERYEIYTKALEALKTDSKDKAQTLNLAYSYREAGFYAEAEKAFRRLVQVDETDADALFGLARVQVNKGEYQQAEETFYKILKIYPLYMLVYEELLDVYKNKSLPPNKQFLEQIKEGLSYEESDKYADKFRQMQETFNALGQE